AFVVQSGKLIAPGQKQEPMREVVVCRWLRRVNQRDFFFLLFLLLRFYRIGGPTKKSQKGRPREKG
ncbi:MAG: hypothetical protein LH609_08010, partial [Rudanella sp.]|nr:hypothetical protein [Rudanella sp.]